MLVRISPETSMNISLPETASCSVKGGRDLWGWLWEVGVGGSSNFQSTRCPIYSYCTELSEIARHLELNIALTGSRVRLRLMKSQFAPNSCHIEEYYLLLLFGGQAPRNEVIQNKSGPSMFWCPKIGTLVSLIRNYPRRMSVRKVALRKRQKSSTRNPT